MSIEQADAFRTFVNENESVQQQIRQASADGGPSLSDLAAKHGYEFTAEEAQSSWNAAQEGELSEFDLEMVAGGALAIYGVRRRTTAGRRGPPPKPGA